MVRGDARGQDMKDPGLRGNTEGGDWATHPERKRRKKRIGEEENENERDRKKRIKRFKEKEEIERGEG